MGAADGVSDGFSDGWPDGIAEGARDPVGVTEGEIETEGAAETVGDAEGTDELVGTDEEVGVMEGEEVGDIVELAGADVVEGDVSGLTEAVGVGWIET